MGGPGRWCGFCAQMCNFGADEMNAEVIEWLQRKFKISLETVQTFRFDESVFKWFGQVWGPKTMF